MRGWHDKAHRLTSHTCDGEADCTYEPKRGLIGGRSGCDLAWRRYSREVFAAFRTANPGLLYRDDGTPCLMAIKSPSHMCPTKYQRCVTGDYPTFDHQELCRFPDGEKMVLSQPYGCDVLKDWDAKVRGLAATDAGKDKAWYLPGVANLVLIGREDVLARVRLDYDVPTGTMPTGCRRYPLHTRGPGESENRMDQ